MKFLLSVMALLFCGVAAAQTTATQSRLQVSNEFRPPVRYSCNNLSYQNKGAICYNQSDDNLYAYDGSGWNEVGSPESGESTLFFNVKDHGAVGNGVTDDTAAIQATIDAAQGYQASTAWGGGGKVYFPPGRYIISSPLVIKRTDRPSLTLDYGPVVLEGASFGSSSLTTSSSFPDSRAIIEWEDVVKKSYWNIIRNLNFNIVYTAGKTNIWAVHFDVSGTPASRAELYNQRFQLETENVVVYGDNRTAAGGFWLEGNVYLGRFVNTSLDLAIDSTANMLRDSILFKFSDGTYDVPWSDQDGCSTCYFEDVRVGGDRGLGGIIIEGQLYQSTVNRATAIAPNYVWGSPFLYLKKSFNVNLWNLQLEGATGTPDDGPMIIVEDSWTVNFKNLGLGCPPTSGKDGVSFINTSYSEVAFTAHETGWCGFQYYGTSKYKMLLDANSRHNTITIPSAGPVANEISDLGTDNNWIGFDYNTEVWNAGGTRYVPPLRIGTGDAVTGTLSADGSLTLRADADNDGSGTERIEIDSNGDSTSDWTISATQMTHSVESAGYYQSAGNVVLGADSDADDTANEQIFLQHGGAIHWIFDRAGSPRKTRLWSTGNNTDANATSIYWTEPTAANTQFVQDASGTLLLGSSAGYQICGDVTFDTTANIAGNTRGTVSNAATMTGFTQANSTCACSFQGATPPAVAMIMEECHSDGTNLVATVANPTAGALNTLNTFRVRYCCNKQ